MGGWSKVDIICLGTSLIGIVFWQVTHNAMYALIFSISADFIGQIPMLLKTYRHPETEIWTFYFLDATAAALNLLAAGHFVLYEFALPMYVVLLDSSITALILRPRIVKNNK